MYLLLCRTFARTFAVNAPETDSLENGRFEEGTLNSRVRLLLNRGYKFELPNDWESVPVPTTSAAPATTTREAAGSGFLPFALRLRPVFGFVNEMFRKQSQTTTATPLNVRILKTLPPAFVQYCKTRLGYSANPFSSQIKNMCARYAGL